MVNPPRRASLGLLIVLVASSVLPAWCLVPGREPPGQRSPERGIPTGEPSGGQSPTQGAPAGGAPVTPPADAGPAAPPASTGDTTGPAPGNSAGQPDDQQRGGGERSGEETPGGNFSLTSPKGVIYDMGRGLAVARGDVTFTYREFTVTGDQGVVDYNTNRATISGNLKVKVRGQEFEGKTLVFELDTGRWTLSNIETVFPPDFFPPGAVLEPIYLSQGEVTGVDDAVGGRNFQVSSCDRDHYFLKSKRIDFYRDGRGEISRIAARRNALYAFGRKIVPLPVYAIALTGERSRRIGLQPTFGYDDINGAFVRSLYPLGESAKRSDSLLLDAFQKRGLGLGFQRELAAGAGILSIYALTGQTGGREINTTVRRTWQISRGLTSVVNIQSTKNNANSINTSGVSNQNADLTFALNQTRVQSTLSFRQASTGSGFGDFKSLAATFQHRQEFSKRLTYESSHLYNSNTFGTTSSSETLDNTFLLNQRGKRFDTFLRTELHDDLSDNDLGGSYQLERVPEFGFVSDTDRFKIPFLSRVAPGELRLEVGRFSEPSFQSQGAPSRQQLTRYDFFYGARQRTFGLLKLGAFRSNLETNARFNQAFYSNNTARYDYDYLFRMNNKLGPLTATVNYAKQRPVGYTPFQFDFLTPGEYMDTEVTFQPSDKLSLVVTGGRDIRNGVSRDILTRLRFTPSPSFFTSLGASYSPETHRYGDVISNLRLRRDPEKWLGGALALGVRYSPASNKITRINAQTDLLVMRGTRLQALTSYNGFAKQFDFNQIRVVRDLHCFNLYMTFDQQRKQLRFDLALKAFPFIDSTYGRSRFGEGQDALIGDVR